MWFSGTHSLAFTEAGTKKQKNKNNFAVVFQSWGYEIIVASIVFNDYHCWPAASTVQRHYPVIDILYFSKPKQFCIIKKYVSNLYIYIMARRTQEVRLECMHTPDQ